MYCVGSFSNAFFFVEVMRYPRTRVLCVITKGLPPRNAYTQGHQNLYVEALRLARYIIEV